MANIFKEAAKYRKDHPRISFQDAIQKVKGKVSGVKAKLKTKKIGAAKTVAKKTVIRKKVATAKVHTRRSSKESPVIKQATAIVSKINRLETKRKNAKERDMKDIIQLEINKQHKQLRAIKQSFK